MSDKNFYYDTVTKDWKPVTSNGDVGQVYQILPDVYASEIPNEYSFTLAPSDIMVPEKRANGASYTTLVQDMLTEDKYSTIFVKREFSLPHRIYLEASVSQRVAGDYQAIEIYEADATDLAAPTAFTVSSITQSTTTLTAVLSTAYDGKVGDWVCFYGCADNRLNYYNAAIATISADKLTLTVTTADDAAIPSLTIGPFVAAGQYMIRQDQLGLRPSGYAIRFSGTSVTSAALLSRFDGNTVAAFGTVGGAQLSTIGSTAAVYTSGATGQVELKPTTRYMLDARPEAVAWLDKGIDSASAQYTARGARTNVKPANQDPFKMRMRAVTPKSMPRPICKIVKAEKLSASTTATIYTDVAHGLVTGQYVTIKGIRDQTNFASLTTAAAVTVLTSTTFTITIGAAAIATSYGGSVVLANAQKDQPGVIASTIQSVARDAAGRVTIVGSATFAGLFNIGDYLTIHGVRDNTAGADLGFDGVYCVNTISTTTLVLDVVVDYTGATRSPTGGVVTTTNCGGTIIHNTTIRIHDLGIESYDEHEVRIAGQGTTRTDLSIPIAVVASLPAGTNTIGTALANGVQANQSATMPQPVLISTYGVSANPTAGTTGRQQQLLGTLIGAAVVKPYSIPEADWRYTGTLTTNTATAAKAAGAAGIKNYVTGIQIQNTNAVATTFLLVDGATTIWTVSLPASMTLPVDFVFPTPLAGTAATAMNVNCGTTGANVLTNVQGYQAP